MNEELNNLYSSHSSPSIIRMITYRVVRADMEGDEARIQTSCLETGGITSKTSMQILKDSPEIDLQECASKMQSGSCGSE
jgi:hypothetical protein